MIKFISHNNAVEFDQSLEAAQKDGYEILIETFKETPIAGLNMGSQYHAPHSQLSIFIRK